MLFLTFFASSLTLRARKGWSLNNCIVFPNEGSFPRVFCFLIPFSCIWLISVPRKLWIRYKKASLTLMRLTLFPSLPFSSPVCSSERTGKTRQKTARPSGFDQARPKFILTLVTVTQMHLFNASTKICGAKKKTWSSIHIPFKISPRTDFRTVLF